MGSFTCVAVSPIEFSPPSLAVAAARAGGAGILDAEFCPDESSLTAVSNLRRLVELTSSSAIVGLRIRGSQLSQAAVWLDCFGERSHWLVVSQWQTQEATRGLRELASRPNLSLWLELTDLSTLAPENLEFAGWIARGSESGGWTGSASAFLLAQHLSRQSHPFVVGGGIGLHSAAACRQAGAAGVVLDDQILCMRESPLPFEHRELLAGLGADESQLLGESLAAPCRVPRRPNLPAAENLSRCAAALESGGGAPEERSRLWRVEADRVLGWASPETNVWPVGQAAGFAGAFARRYQTTGRLIRELMEGVAAHLADAARLSPLAPGSPLAQSHGVRYPIVQGPMTRVSDNSRFAASVADAGALPFLSLALMRRADAESLLRETKELLKDRAWGVGILGFVPPDLRSEQMAAIEAAQPPFALIAGGRPEQALFLERKGIPTYVHVPSPRLLSFFLEQGVRRFVFEGAECGGHVGPLASFALWDSMVEALLREAAPETAADIHVLFAGGVHDAVSAAMVGALASPLAARGMRVGVLMGTAYLFTHEAVASGAIVPAFQREALECRRTVKLVTGAGHAIRCAETPFATEFAERKRDLAARGLPVEELRGALETVTLGRSRTASKGLVRDSEGCLASIPQEEQRQQGMYMMGEAAALRGSALSMEQLHREVSLGGARMLEDASAKAEKPRRGADPCRVAVIGIACHVPGASGPPQFWRNLLDGANSIGEIPPHRWDWRLYYDADPQARDKIYSKWGGFVPETHFDPLRFGIPPNSLKSIATSQLLGLEIASRALDDAGYSEGGFNRRNTSVIFGVTNPADLQHMYVARSMLPLCSDRIAPETWERMPEWSEESLPGILMNVMAGRVANRLDLGGPSYTVDAACASSLAALSLAVQELRSGRSDMVVTGGIDLEMTPYTFLCFSKTRALSPNGRARVFDEGADGIVLSEGVVSLVLKRLEDAERDGDRIYGVIQAVAGSSDGKGLGITAPNSTGQRLALQRAYESAGIDCATLRMYEAHGTGTAVGDRAELESIVAALREAGAPARSCAIGSAKSLLGHTKASAGVVGLAKVLLALYYKALPPHAGVERPLPALAAGGSPVYVHDQATPWLADGFPRRAGVSAFGFGGVNFHAVVEEYAGETVGRATGAGEWPWNLFVVRAGSAAELAQRLRSLGDELEGSPHSALHELALRSAGAGLQTGSPACAACLVIRDRSQLRDGVDALLQRLGGDQQRNLPAGVHLRLEGAAPGGEVAFLFPGQGSQYPGMMREVSLYLPEMRGAIEFAEQRVEEGLLPGRLSRIVWPHACFSDDERDSQASRLADTRAAQLALAAVSSGMLEFVRRIGVTPDRVAGHSFGEYVALHAAGVIDRQALLALTNARGRAIAEAGLRQPGGMAAVNLGAAELRSLMESADGVAIANLNAPDQSVLSGETAALRAAVERLEKRGVSCRILSVSCAFHSPSMRPACEALRQAIDAAALGQSRFPVHCSRDGEPYPAASSEIRGRLLTHLEAPVDFVAQILRMYESGVRTFIEIGPKAVLTGLAGRILQGRPHRAIALDGAGGGMKGLLEALAQMELAGIPVDLRKLYADLPRQTASMKPAVQPSPAWLIDGGRIRRKEEAAGLIGALPLLTQDSVRSRALELGDAANGLSITEGSAVSVYREYQETMRRFLALQESTVSRVLDQLGNGARPDGAVILPGLNHRTQAEAPAPLVESNANGNGHAAKPSSTGGRNGHAARATLNRAAVSQILLDIVCKQTGYPQDLMHLNQDLEADLGIDSLKRVEIFMNLERRLGEATGGSMTSLFDRLEGSKSLAGILDRVMQKLASGMAPDGAAEAIIPVRSASGGSSSGSCPRFLMRGEPAELPSLGRVAIKGLVLVTEDELGVAQPVLQLLRERGITAELISRQALAAWRDLDRRIFSLRIVHGPIQGIVHLAPLTQLAADGVAAWRSQLQVQTKSLFRLLQLCEEDLREATSANAVRVIAATAFGGHWGRGGANGITVAGGGCHGLLRTLESEYPNAVGKVVDFDAVALTAAQQAERIVDELLLAGGPVEVGYAGGKRYVFHAAAQPVVETAPDHSWRPRPGWVILLTGGARGITGRLRTLAGPGIKLVVVGCAHLEETGDPRQAPDHAPNMEEIRERMLAEIRTTEGNLTPRQIEARVRERFHAQERAFNLAEFRRLGAEVEYRCCDVGNAEEFGELIDDTYARHGRLDAVVHGAGIVEDERLSEKLPESFDRVFDTKALSAFTLLRRLRPEGLKWVALAGSVAGRFGNRGQWDYAAANEVVNRLAWQMQAQWPAARVLVLNWGPWRGVGMSSQSLAARFEQQGITPIEPADGVRFFERELTYGLRGEVEVVAGDGPWKGDSDTLLNSVVEVSLLLMQIRGAMESVGAAL